MIFKSKEHAQFAHMNYHIDTATEGKFNAADTSWPRYKQIVDWIPNGSKVAELGCNSGGLGMLLKEKGCDYIGIDVCERLVKIAQWKGLNAIHGEAENTMLRNNVFDVVVAAELLEHVFSPTAVILEVARILKHDGVFIGSVPHENGYNTLKKPVEQHAYHCRVFTKDILQDVFSDFFEKIMILEVPNTDTVTPQHYLFRCTNV